MGYGPMPMGRRQAGDHCVPFETLQVTVMPHTVWKVMAVTSATCKLAGSQLSSMTGSVSPVAAMCPAFAYTRTNGNL